MIPRLPRALWFTIAACIVIGLIFAVARCTRPTDSGPAQAQQTSASAAAVSDAATVAIDVLQDRVATETQIDRAVAVGVLEIENATDPDAVRAAVIASVCQSPAHYSDPACTVR